MRIHKNIYIVRIVLIFTFIFRNAQMDLYKIDSNELNHHEKIDKLISGGIYEQENGRDTTNNSIWLNDFFLALNTKNIDRIVQCLQKICYSKIIPSYQEFTELCLASLLNELLDDTRQISTQNTAIQLISLLCSVENSRQYIEGLVQENVPDSLIHLLFTRKTDSNLVIQCLDAMMVCYEELASTYSEQMNVLFLLESLKEQSNSAMSFSIVSNFLKNFIALKPDPPIIKLFFNSISQMIQANSLDDGSLAHVLSIINQGPVHDSPCFHELIQEFNFPSIVYSFLRTYQRTCTEITFELLSLFARIVERPVDIKFDYSLFISYFQSDDIQFKQKSLEVIGNLFETDPKSIEIFLNMAYFDELYAPFEFSPAQIKYEIIICTASAICYGSSKIIDYLLTCEFDYISNAIEIYSILHVGLEYLILNSFTEIWIHISNHNGISSAINYFEERDMSSFLDSLKDQDDDEANQKAAQKLINCFLKPDMS